jgi:hypothetical protein
MLGKLLSRLLITESCNADCRELFELIAIAMAVITLVGMEKSVDC